MINGKKVKYLTHNKCCKITDTNKWKLLWAGFITETLSCLSRMKGNFHVRFLGGKAPVRELTYPAGRESTAWLFGNRLVSGKSHVQSSYIWYGFCYFVRKVQDNRAVAEQLNVFELLALYKMAMRDCEGLDEKILWKLSEENLIGYENGSHRLSEEYRNESAERLKGMNMNYLKLVSGCFHKNGYINRSFLKRYFKTCCPKNKLEAWFQRWKMQGLYRKMVQANIPVM